MARTLSLLWMHLLVSLLWCSPSLAQQSIVLLKNGMQLGPGSVGDRASLNQSGFATGREGGEIQAKPILFVDDELRVTYFHNNKLANQVPLSFQPIRINLPNEAKRATTKGNQALGVLGSSNSITPFDEYGRRVFTTSTQRGPRSIVQGITEISAHYVRVDSLQTESTLVWDMRLALSAVPRKTLFAILKRKAESGKPQDWLDIVSMLIEAERYNDAREFLELAIREQPSLESQRNQLQAIDQREAEMMFREVQNRQAAGQYQLAEQLLRNCDVKKLSDETRIKVASRVRKIEEDQASIEQTVASIKKLHSELGDANLKEKLAPLVDEISKHLNVETLVRVADFLRLQDDRNLTVDQRLALALGGWLLGSGIGMDNIATVRSAWDTRKLVNEFINTSSSAVRSDIIEALRGQEAGAPSLLSKIIRNMPPPVALPPNDDLTPGRFRIEVPVKNGSAEEKVAYWLQLPPEYDPYRNYPCILALRSEYWSAELELEWWTGRFDPVFKQPLGEACRHGFIVIAPEWMRPKQTDYEFTEIEHHRVLVCLRDAMRRTSLDTDRIFISGHQAGGSAAWDVAVSHPDLWAGLVCISGNSSSYTKNYRNNARYFPIYYVGGDMEGPQNPLVRNGEILDDYVRMHPNCMVTMYRGRGKDHFQEELPRIMQWLRIASHVRGPTPEKFQVRTTRPGDNYFWLLEITSFPLDKINNPFLDFEPKKVMEVEVSRTKTSVHVEGFLAEGFTLWFDPEMVDFSQDILVSWPRNRKKFKLNPDIATLLEDVRQRGDRQRPFWAQLQLP